MTNSANTPVRVIRAAVSDHEWDTGRPCIFHAMDLVYHYPSTDPTVGWEDVSFGAYVREWVLPGKIQAGEITYGQPLPLQYGVPEDEWWYLPEPYALWTGQTAFFGDEKFVVAYGEREDIRSLRVGTVNEDLGVTLGSPVLVENSNYVGPSSAEYEAQGSVHVASVGGDVGVMVWGFYPNRAVSHYVWKAAAFRVVGTTVVVGPKYTLPIAADASSGGYQLWPPSPYLELVPMGVNRAVWGGTNIPWNSSGPSDVTHELLVIDVNPNSLALTIGSLDTTTTNVMTMVKLDDEHLFITDADRILDDGFYDYTHWVYGSIIKVNSNRTFTVVARELVCADAHTLIPISPEQVLIGEGTTGNGSNSPLWWDSADGRSLALSGAFRVIDIDIAEATITVRQQPLYNEGHKEQSTRSRPGVALGDNMSALVPNTDGGRPYIVTVPPEGSTSVRYGTSTGRLTRIRSRRD